MTRLRQESGMVLLVVLVVVTLLSALLIEFAYSTLVDLRLTETFRDSTRAWYLARGGLTVGRMMLQEDTNGYDAPADPEEYWAQGVSNYPVGEGVVNIAIEDLGGRLSINALVGSDGSNVDRVQKRRFYRLFAALGIVDGEQLTGALIDWIDRDSVLYVDPDSGASLGAEEEVYRQHRPPRGCKNAPFDTLEELALVRGFTPDVMRLAAPHLSVHGGTAVNVNTATAEVLMSLSDDPVIDRVAAEAIMEDRREEPFRSGEDLQRLNRIPGLENLLRTSLAVSSTTYRIDTWAWVNDGGRRVEAIVEKPGDRLLFLKVN